MKIGLDVTFLFDQYAFRGIGNYGREVTRELLKHKEHEWVLFGYGNQNTNLAELATKPSSNIHFITLGNKRKSTVSNLLFFNFTYLPKIKKQKLDLFFSCNFEQGLPLGATRVAVTVHDVIPFITKSFSQKGKVINFLKGIFYRYNLNRAKKADIIFASSEFTKNELITKAGFDPSKITRSYLGIKEGFKIENIDTEDRDIRRTLITYNITSPYMICYGGIETNKNVYQVIRSFYEVSNRFPDLRLVIIGKEFKLGWDNKVKPLTNAAAGLLKLCSDLKIKHRVIFTGEAQENHMPVIVSNAKFMLNLSLYEGFGLTVLESLASGVPLIASNKSCYPEILGDAAILVDPNDVKQIGQQIENLLTDNTLYKQMREKGIKRASQFSWQNTTGEILDTFNTNITQKLNKKIIYIIPYFYPFSGGAEENCLALATETKKMGADVKVFTSYRKDFTCPRFENYNGIEIHRFKRFNNSYYMGFYPGLFLKLLSSKADIIHVHGIGFIWQDVCVFIKKIFSPRTKYINTPHGPFMTLSNYSATAKILKTIYSPFLKLMLHNTYNNFIEVNPNQEKWITKYSIKKEKIIYIPNGINKGLIEQSVIEKSEIEKFNLNNKFVVSFIGRYEEYKGLQDIIKAVAALKKSIKNIHLVAMGAQGSYLNTLIELVKSESVDDSVSILVNPDNKTKFEILSLSKVFILPSKWEAFGISILEAMAKGNAIITTDTEGGSFLIKDDENGFLIKYGDVESLSSNILKLYKDKPLLEKIHLNNIEKAKQFTWDKIIKSYAKTIES